MHFNHLIVIFVSTRRIYQDARASQNIDRLNADLHDVTRVMTKNIEDLLYRGDSLDKMSELSGTLRQESQKYKKAAQNINFWAIWKQYGPIGIVCIIILILLYWRFFW